jgi:hypothetical protein
MQATSDQLRELVREVLREVVPAKATGLSAVETVRITTDDELARFVQRVLAMQDAIKANRLRFTLSHQSPPANGPIASGAVLEGVVTEQIVDRHAGSGVLLLSAQAVITPLGRDRARKLGLKVERRP